MAGTSKMVDWSLGGFIGGLSGAVAVGVYSYTSGSLGTVIPFVVSRPCEFATCSLVVALVGFVIGWAIRSRIARSEAEKLAEEQSCLLDEATDSVGRLVRELADAHAQIAERDEILLRAHDAMRRASKALSGHHGSPGIYSDSRGHVLFHNERMGSWTGFCRCKEAPFRREGKADAYQGYF